MKIQSISMKRIVIIASAVLSLTACKSQIEASVPAYVKDGVIEMETPEREPGQMSALQLTSEPIDTVRIGFVGIGARGCGAILRFTQQENVKIVALCDIYADQLANGQYYVEHAGLPKADEYIGADSYKQLCERDDIDLVYITTSWAAHTPVSVYAMEHGKHVACEVPAALSIDECWQLVNTCEKTRKHFMMLENCCYDFYEMSALNMAQHGLFGEIYHVEGAYIHNLDPFWGQYIDNWRLGYNQAHRGDNYPTHGIGPVCQVLNIHRGDRMDYVVSQDTRSFHGLKVAKERMGSETFADGDHTVSLIRTVKGKQIEIQHNVYSGRPYSRMYQITATDGFASKYPTPSFALQPDPETFLPQSKVDSLLEVYKPAFVREIEEKARRVGGHGGMDFIMDYRLIYCLRNGLPLDQDVYDAAEWCCLTELSGLSCSHNSMPVRVPDFTRGDWQKIDGYSHAVK